MLKLYLLSNDGVDEKSDINEAMSEAQKKNGVLWVDMHSPSSEDIDLVSNTYKFHDIEKDSLSKQYTRPHIAEYEDHFHVNFTYIKSNKSQLHPQEFHIFLGKNYIVTSGGDATHKICDEVMGLYRDQPTLSQRGSYYVLYLLTDFLIDTYTHLADDMDDQVDKIEDEMSEHADKKSLQDLFKVKRRLFDLRRYLSPQRDVFNQLARGGFQFVDPGHEAYFQDAYNRMSRVFDSIDISRDILSATLDLYQSTVSNRLNDIMRILTIFAVILGIFAFITGFFGMNVINFPKFPLIPGSIWSIVITVIITACMLLWFRSKGWL